MAVDRDADERIPYERPQLMRLSVPGNGSAACQDGSGDVGGVCAAAGVGAFAACQSGPDFA